MELSKYSKDLITAIEKGYNVVDGEVYYNSLIRKCRIDTTRL